MSSALLNKLKQSKKPKMQKTVAISLSAAKPGKIKTTVLDKSGLESVNRQDFMKDITTTVTVPDELSRKKPSIGKKPVLDKPPLSKIMEEGLVESDERKESEAIPKQKLKIKVKKK